jgi:hypothetical protein
VKATDEQILAALEKHNGRRDRAAQEVGLGASRFRERLTELKAKGASVPASSVAGTSTLYDASGKQVLQWVKEQPGKLTPEKIAEAVRDALTDIPKAAKVPAPKQLAKDLLVEYPIGDHHVGMYSWAEETGADYDLKIAESLLTSAITHLVDIAPASENAVVADLGDMTHYDTIRTETVRSHNTLDADSRYHAMIRVALRLLVACVDRALTKHKHVTVIVAPGNHDDMGAAWRVEALALYYAREPRVTVMAKAGKFFYYEFGKNLIGYTHGDTGKPEKLAGVMAADQPEAWGRTRFRYWHTGHVHSKSVIEMQGVTWESFRILPPGDAWSHAAGYRAAREMNAIVYHRAHGEVGRHTFNPSMLAAA